jgi:hypothetical protein
MADALVQFRDAAMRYRVQSVAIVASSIAAFALLGLGVRLRRSAEPVRLETRRLSATAAEVSGFRAAFVSSSPDDDSRLSQLADSLGAAVPRDDRVALAQQVAARAEALGLLDVRVRFTPADSMALPHPPALSSSAIAVADYALALDGDGNLVSVLSLLGRLPPSVALERITAARARGTARYHMTFTVFESTSTRSSQASGATLAELVSFAKPVEESLPPTRVVATAAAVRDPFGGIAPTQPVVRLAARPVRGAPKAVAPAWDVTATLIAGARRAALINGVLVSVGDAVASGVTLTAVERDRVVLTDQKGAAHTIAVKEGER